MSSSSVFPNYSLIPPHMLPEIIRNNGDSSQQMTTSLLIDVNRIFIANPVKPEPVMAAPTTKVSRFIYDASTSWFDIPSPGELIRSEGGPAVNDDAANEVYDYLGVTCDFFQKKFQRDSIFDNSALPLNASIHYYHDIYGNDYINTYCSTFWNYWDPSGGRMIFGDGDGVMLNRPTACIDIVAGTLTRGIIMNMHVLIKCRYEDGALLQSMSDVFGSMVKQFYKNQTAEQADWLIGEGLINSKLNVKGLRSLANPGTAYDNRLLGKDRQVAHMNNYLYTHDNDGGVNTNAGILNRAFYLAATKLGGYSWEKAGKIWYEALCDQALKDWAYYGVTFLVFSYVTINKARSLFGQDTADKVRDAWIEVGVKVS